MLGAERKDLLLDRLARDGRIVARDLARELGLSEDSIRRDLRELAAAGLCHRVYGGALPVSPAVVDFDARTSIATDAKGRVAVRALDLLVPGSTVFVDGGTTALEVARRLPRGLELSVVTHSPAVALALVDAPGVEVTMIGGRLFRHSLVMGGAAAAEAVQRLTVDLFLLGVTGVHAQHGLTTGEAEDAAVKRIVAGRAAETYVLASSEKIGAASPFTVVGFADVAGIVTDAPASMPAMVELVARGVAVVEA